MQRGIKGVGAGIGDGADRQALPTVGIVGIQYRLGYVIVVVRLDVIPDVIVGGAALQHGVGGGILQAVVEHRGDIVHFLHVGGFLLHDGSEDGPFLQRKAAFGQRLLIFFGQQLFFKVGQLGADDIVGGGIRKEGVGIGIQEPIQHDHLALVGADLTDPVEGIIHTVGGLQILFGRAKPGGLDGVGHLKGIVALRQGDADRFPVGDGGAERFDEFGIAAALFQGEAAVLVAAVAAVGAAVQPEQHGIADEPRRLQLPGDDGGGAALRDGDGDRFAGFSAAGDLAPDQQKARDQQDGEKKEKDTAGAAFFAFFAVCHKISPVYRKILTKVEFFLLYPKNGQKSTDTHRMGRGEAKCCKRSCGFWECILR